MAQDDIQAVAPDGSTHVFPANTSDDVIDRTMKSYIASNAPITPQSMMAKSQQQAQTEGQRPLVQAVQQRGVQDRQAQALDRSLHKPSGLENTIGQVKKGNYPGAVHAAASGLASAYSPLAAPALMTAPIPALAGLAGSAAGKFLGKNTAAAFGASPDLQDVAGDIGAAAGGFGGYKLGDAAPSMASNFLRDPETNKIDVSPSGLLNRSGIVNKIVPPNPQFQGNQVAAGRNEMYNDLATRAVNRGEEQEQLDNQFSQRLQGEETARQKQLAATERLRNMEAQSIQNRGKQQEILDRAHNPYGPNETPPFEPSIYSSPQEYDQSSKNEEPKEQASSAGTYHAAQGAVGKRTTLQQRITNRFDAPIEDPYSPTR